MKLESNSALGIFASPGLIRRAPKATPAHGINQPDPYAICMACWIEYMQTDDRDLGAKGMKLKGEERDSEKDVYERQLAADLKIGEAVNAMVDSLQIRDRWAIYRSQGISSAWRFSEVDYSTILSNARDELEKKLRKNIATRIYFL